MRDLPFVLFIPWGKNRGAHYFRNCLQPKKDPRAPRKNQRGSAPLNTPRGDKIPLDPQKKEEPRGNGARNRRKT